MARIGIVYRKDDILDILLDREPNFVGIAIGKKLMRSEGGRIFDGGLGEYPFTPQIYKLYSYDRPIGYRSDLHEVPIDNITYARYNRDTDVYDIMVDRDDLTEEDRIEFYNDAELTFPGLFDFSFFSKQELETVLSLSISRVIFSGSKIQIGRGALDYGGGALGDDTNIYVFTLKVEADPITEAADLGLPEWIAGAPCPPRWR